ncbi:MAG TPA: hypothetical protein VK956_19220 [Verrucomicrobium sp.]|nr:hypothetical protein [Verrucomicrobium sp.]
MPALPGPAKAVGDSATPPFLLHRARLSNTRSNPLGGPIFMSARTALDIRQPT